MVKNYILVALRNLKKQKTYSLINIIGLAVGMTGFAFFALTAGVKLNADKFHNNAHRIYSVVQVLQSENMDEEHTVFTPAPLLQALRNELPEIEDGLRVLPVNKITIKRGQDAFYENNALFVDPNFLNFFTFKMIAGNPEAALADPYSIVLSETAAFKYFGDSDPIGQVLTLGKNVDVTVRGIIRNVPRTSTIVFDFLIPMEMGRPLLELKEDWQINSLATFVLLPAEFTRAQAEAKLPALIEKYLGGTPESPKDMYMFPLTDFRLNSEHITSFMRSSNRASVFIVFGFGIILLLVVSINFINLSLARYMQRIREIGVRKVIGARRTQLIVQFISESVVLSLIALPVALILYELIEPFYTAQVGNFYGPLYMSHASNSIWNYPFLIKYLLITSLLVGIFSGAYPALFLSSFRPAAVLKGSVLTGRQKRPGSKILIVTQFTLSIIFIAFASLLKTQFDHLLKADFGYNRERVAIVRLSDESRSKLESIKTEVSHHPGITAVSAAQNLPIIWSSRQPAQQPGQTKEEAISVQAYGVDHDFTRVLDMEVIRGRRFSKENNDGNNFILNESMVKRLNWQDPIGKPLTVGARTGMVIGVVKDFIFDDVGFEIPPTVLFLNPENLNFFYVKYSPSHDFRDIEKFLKEQWQILAPDLPFDCISLDYYFQDSFAILDRLSDFFNIIGFVAVFFSCLGLFGLVSYLVEQRTKEIGIRKVLGASMTRITWTMVREFILLVLIANIIGLCIIYFGWKKVLQTGILFMTEMSVGTYFYIILISVTAALVAVSSQALKSAMADPVDSLRYE